MAYTKEERKQRAKASAKRYYVKKQVEKEQKKAARRISKDLHNEPAPQLWKFEPAITQGVCCVIGTYSEIAKLMKEMFK